MHLMHFSCKSFPCENIVVQDLISERKELHLPDPSIFKDNVHLTIVTLVFRNVSGIYRLIVSTPTYTFISKRRMKHLRIIDKSSLRMIIWKKLISKILLMVRCLHIMLELLNCGKIFNEYHLFRFMFNYL